MKLALSCSARLLAAQLTARFPPVAKGEPRASCDVIWKIRPNQVVAHDEGRYVQYGANRDLPATISQGFQFRRRRRARQLLARARRVARLRFADHEGDGRVGAWLRRDGLRAHQS